MRLFFYCPGARAPRVPAETECEPVLIRCKKQQKQPAHDMSQLAGGAAPLALSIQCGYTQPLLAL
jgi:hypothetical protein